MPRSTSHTRTRKRAHSRLAVVARSIIEGNDRAARVLYFHENDGFTILNEAMADEDPAQVEREDLAVVCLSCLVDLAPELGRGLDLARGSESGGARLYRGEWMEELPE